MNGEAKYIVFKNDFGQEIPLVFDAVLPHNSFKVLGDIISAGFVQFSEEGACCFGKSISLKLDSRGKEDSELINWRILRKGF